MHINCHVILQRYRISWEYICINPAVCLSWRSSRKLEACGLTLTSLQIMIRDICNLIENIPNMEIMKFTMLNICIWNKINVLQYYNVWLIQIVETSKVCQSIGIVKMKKNSIIYLLIWFLFSLYQNTYDWFIQF